MMAANVAKSPTCDVDGFAFETLPERNNKPENLPCTKSGNKRRVLGTPVDVKKGSLLKRFALVGDEILEALIGCKIGKISNTGLSWRRTRFTDLLSDTSMTQ